MSETDDQSKDIVVATTGAAASAIAQAATAALRLGPEVSASLAVFAGAIPSLIRFGFAKRAERRSVLAAEGMEVAARQQDTAPSAIVATDSAEDVFLSMFYDLIDAVDDAAAQPLGHLAMTYAHWNMGPDRFFRAFGRVVRELDANELSDLARLLEDCVRRIDSHKAAFSDSAICRTRMGCVIQPKFTAVSEGPRLARNDAVNLETTDWRPQMARGDLPRYGAPC